MNKTFNIIIKEGCLEHSDKERGTEESRITTLIPMSELIKPEGVTLTIKHLFYKEPLDIHIHQGYGSVR